MKRKSIMALVLACALVVAPASSQLSVSANAVSGTEDVEQTEGEEAPEGENGIPVVELSPESLDKLSGGNAVEGQSNLTETLPGG